jgi:hypothetical protein
MAEKPKLLWGAGIVVAVLGLALVAIRLSKTGRPRNLLAPLTLLGAVLRQDDDPRNQTPLANVEVTAADGSVTLREKSASSGLFKLTLRPHLGTGRRIALKFASPGYQPLTISVPHSVDRLLIVRMRPLVRQSASKADAAASLKIVRIRDVRIRYLSNEQTAMNVGSLAKQYEVANMGNVACDKREPCSPDGKWKAATNLISLDAQEGNEFQNVRVLCIAGPCPFTKVESDDLSRPARKIRIKISDWSDTANFLVEADIVRTLTTNKVLYTYPFIVGQTMNFALPEGSEGLSIEATLNGREIVFPVGPDSLLSWATCGVETPAGGNRFYRCQLKPEYAFEP